MKRSERLIQAVQRVAKRLASSGDFDDLLKDALTICVDAVGASAGTIYLHDPEGKKLVFRHVLPPASAEKLPGEMPDDVGLAGQAFQERRSLIVEYPEKDARNLTTFEKSSGVPIRNSIATPLMMEDEEPIGVVQLLNKDGAAFDEADQAVLETLAAVSTMAFLNARLIEDAIRASSLLGMGKVSHDIGNLAANLHAGLSYSTMAIDQLRAKTGKDAAPEIETLESMVDEVSASANRIVGYAQLISDLSAGRELRPTKKSTDLSATILASLAYFEAELRKLGIVLETEVEPGPPIAHDELYVFRIIQNLVGNAIKAVRETAPLDAAEEETIGRVSVRYRFDGRHVIEVSDTGSGMDAATIQRILSGSARSQWERGTGSGWGTRIVLELAASHGGTVSIDSAKGQGTTFRVCFPA